MCAWWRGRSANDDNLEELIYQVRRHTKVLISFGDCAVTANVPAMRNMPGNSAEGVLERGYLELADEHPQLPHAPGIVPDLLERVTPVHEAGTPVDIFMPGCRPLRRSHPGHPGTPAAGANPHHGWSNT
jgi:NAD-reducing hydrogenase small subunit